MKHNQFSESRQNGVSSRPYCKCAVNLRSVRKTNNPSDTFVTTRVTHAIFINLNRTNKKESNRLRNSTEILLYIFFIISI